MHGLKKISKVSEAPLFDASRLDTAPHTPSVRDWKDEWFLIEGAWLSSPPKEELIPYVLFYFKEHD